MVKNLNQDQYDKVEELYEDDKLFVVHQEGYAALQLTDIEVDSEHLNGTLEALQQNIYYREGRDKKFDKSERDILNEVHIYLKDEGEKYGLGPQKIALSHIDEFKIIKYNTAKDIPAYVVGIGAIAAFVAIAFKKDDPPRPPEPTIGQSCNCPYVYVDKDNDYVFEGEVLSAAFASNLERDDYMPLPSITENDKSYKIKITNELEERHFIDEADLVIVNHSKKENVLLDRLGNPRSFGKLISPIKASSYGGNDLLSAIETRDRKVFFFNDEDYSKNGVVLKFNRPSDVSSGKLVLQGKNPLWAEYIYDIYANKYGSKYDKWMERQETLPPSERMGKVLGHDIALSVYIKNNNEWKLADYILPVGIYAARDLIVPLDFSSLEGDEIELKVETGFMFWELDFVGIDYSPDIPLKAIAVKPKVAINQDSESVIAELTAADGNYLIHNSMGNETELHFEAPPYNSNQTQSVFFHCRGYYEPMVKMEGKPDRMTLKRFREPGYFSKFSRSLYLEALRKEFYEPSISMN